MARNVRMNRSEKRPSFLSNIVGGGAEQIQPNGCTYDSDPSEKDGIIGAGNQQGFNIVVGPVPSKSWPGGNRSGE